MPEALVGHPRCRVVPAGVTRQDGLKLASGVLRSTRDYLRYHEAPFRGATANRGRALRALVRSVSNGTQELPAEMPDTLLPLNDRSAARLWKALRDLEALIPSDPAFERFIADQRPDVLLVTPLVSLGGRQTEFVKAARRLGVPSALLVFSWDNLSNKGVIHTIPDRVFVWNEVQREEATKLHRVPAAAVVATGAPRFDSFFRMSPSLDRAAFARWPVSTPPGRWWSTWPRRRTSARMSPCLQSVGSTRFGTAPSRCVQPRS
jgi:hypothetical protein